MQPPAYTYYYNAFFIRRTCRFHISTRRNPKSGEPVAVKGPKLPVPFLSRPRHGIRAATISLTFRAYTAMTSHTILFSEHATPIPCEQAVSMLDPRRVIHREIHPQVRNSSPDLKRTPTDGLSAPPVTPEFQFDLAGGRTASPENLFALVKSPDGLTVLMAEGKCAEPKGPRVDARYTKPSTGKTTRLNLKTVQAQTIRYQLLHSAVFAPITAVRSATQADRSLFRAGENMAQHFPPKEPW